MTDIQGVGPLQMHLALGGFAGETVSFRVADYAAYYRLVVRSYKEFLSRGSVFPIESLADPVGQCEVCRWSQNCRNQAFGRRAFGGAVSVEWRIDATWGNGESVAKASTALRA